MMCETGPRFYGLIIRTRHIHTCCQAFSRETVTTCFKNLDVRIPAVKTGSDSSTAKRSVRVSRVLGDDHYKRMPRVTVGVAR